jgi:hypothetical protein
LPGFDTIKVANSRKAHRLLHAAQDADPSGRSAWALKIALFRAHFAGGETISDVDTLHRGWGAGPDPAAEPGGLRGADSASADPIGV